MPISLATKDFVQGGLLNDVDVSVEQAEFCIYNYEGKANLSKDPPLALKLVLKVEDDEAEHTEYITCGSSADFVPNDDDNGNTIMPNGSAKALRKGSNLFLFNESLEQAGFPQAKLAEGKASNYTGVKFHLIRKAAPKRSGLAEQTKEGGYQQQFIACEALISTPWDKASKKTGAAAPKAAGKAQPAAAAVADDAEVSVEITDKALELAGKVLEKEAEKGTTTIQRFKMNFFRLVGNVSQDEKNALATVALDSNTLAALGWEITGDKHDTLTLAA